MKCQKQAQNELQAAISAHQLEKSAVQSQLSASSKQNYWILALNLKARKMVVQRLQQEKSQILQNLEELESQNRKEKENAEFMKRDLEAQKLMQKQNWWVAALQLKLKTMAAQKLEEEQKALKEKLENSKKQRKSILIDKEAEVAKIMENTHQV